LEYFFVLSVGLIAGVVGGIVGFGSSIMLMPVLVVIFGPRQAVPIMAIASIMVNLSRIVVWWREVDWRACAAYAITGAPCAVLGARTLLTLPATVVDIALGGFFIAMVPLRRWIATHDIRLDLWHLALIGAIIGYITGVVATTGPVSAPAFLSYGLVKGAFLATEAAGSLAIYVSKSITFRTLGALPFDALARGLITGSSLMAGTLLAKRVVVKLPAERFRLLMDGLLLVSGSVMLWAAATQ
jgi:uncharacterized protein